MLLDVALPSNIKPPKYHSLLFVILLKLLWNQTGPVWPGTIKLKKKGGLAFGMFNFSWVWSNEKGKQTACLSDFPSLRLWIFTLAQLLDGFDPKAHLSDFIHFILASWLGLAMDFPCWFDDSWYCLLYPGNLNQAAWR